MPCKHFHSTRIWFYKTGIVYKQWYGHVSWLYLQYLQTSLWWALDILPVMLLTTVRNYLLGCLLWFFWQHGRSKAQAQQITYYIVPRSIVFSYKQWNARFPSAKSSSGCSLAYRLFIPAYMITPKVICDDTYSKQHLFICTGVHMIYPNPSHNKLIPTIFIPTTTVHGCNEIQRIEEAQIDLLVWYLSHCHPN